MPISRLSRGRVRRPETDLSQMDPGSRAVGQRRELRLGRDAPCASWPPPWSRRRGSGSFDVVAADMGPQAPLTAAFDGLETWRRSDRMSSLDRGRHGGRHGRTRQAPAKSITSPSHGYHGPAAGGTVPGNDAPRQPCAVGEFASPPFVGPRDPIPPKQACRATMAI